MGRLMSAWLGVESRSFGFMMLWISAVMMAKYTGKLLDMESPPVEFTDGLFLWYNKVGEEE
ncbi:hypothetical protein [Anaerovibrio lipolyticus]|uniref:hypothetical protein n=1 Tax=Anaerovibrio lipolyticus TaxID=82374 RepID=UPI0026EA2500|nr:hypothetical protein [Anaerovibrio lipolyticus]MBE6106936.1 hypothetical protein [Anaerovibrio lipolyticus]